MTRFQVSRGRRTVAWLDADQDKENPTSPLEDTMDTPKFRERCRRLGQSVLRKEMTSCSLHSQFPRKTTVSCTETILLLAELRVDFYYELTKDTNTRLERTRYGSVETRQTSLRRLFLFLSLDIQRLGDSCYHLIFFINYLHR